MKEQSEHSSTEKLLKIIRGEKSPEKKSHAAPQAKVEKQSKRTKQRPKINISPKLLTFQKNLTIGVDIGINDLRLVKIDTSEGSPKLVDYRHVPFNPNASPGSQAFIHYLRSILRDFCGQTKNLEIWSLISSIKVNIFHLRIPKVNKKQIPNTVYWSVQRERSFQEKDFVFDFEVHGDVQEDGITKTSVMAYLVPRSEVENIKDMFARAGYKLTGLTIVPFAVQNIFRSDWTSSPSGTFAVLFIGREWSRIDIFNGRDLVLTRGIRTGLNSFLEVFIQEYESMNTDQNLEFEEDTDSPDKSSEEDEEFEMDTSGLPDEETGASYTFLESTESHDATREGRGRSLMDMAQARKLIFAKLIGQKLSENEAGAELTADQIFTMIHPAVERLVKQIERTFRHYTFTLGNDSVEKIYLSGQISSNSKLNEYIESSLGISKEILDPLNPNIPSVGPFSAPKTLPFRDAFIPALGLALSDNSKTPNLLFTYKDKVESKRSEKLNKAVYGVTAVLFVLLLGLGLWQNMTINQKQKQLLQLQRQAAQYSPKLDKTFLLSLASRAQQRTQFLKTFSQRYEGAAALRELAAITPENIKLLNVNIDLGKPQTSPAKKVTKQQREEPRKTVQIEGIILGRPQSFDADLATYIYILKESVLFGKPVINTNETESFPGQGEVLRFSMTMNLL